MMMAWFLAQRVLPPSFKVIISAFVIIALPAALIARQPDLGTALLVTASGFFVRACRGGFWVCVSQESRQLRL